MATTQTEEATVNKPESAGAGIAGKSQIVELSTESFKAFCEDISAMFSINMRSNKLGASIVKTEALQGYFKNLVAITSIKADGALEGTFQIIFSREGLFTLAGAISMPAEMTSLLEKCIGPEQTMKNIKGGSIKEAEAVSDTVAEACNLLIGSWDRIFREKFEGHKHLLQTNTFIGDPWSNPKEIIGMGSDDEIVFASYKIIISSFPAFMCGAIFPKTILSKADIEAIGVEQKAKAEAEERAKAEAEKKAGATTEEKAEGEAEEKVKAEAEEKAKAEAEEKAKAEAEEKAKAEAEEKAKTEAEEKAKAEAEEKAKAEAEEKGKAEAEEKAKAEAEEKAKGEAEEKAKAEAEEKAKAEAEEKAKAEAEEKAKAEAEEKAKAEPETKTEAVEENDKPEAEAEEEPKAKAEAEEKAKAEAEEKAKAEAEEKAKAEAEEKAKAEAEEKAKAEPETKTEAVEENDKPEAEAKQESDEKAEAEEIAETEEEPKAETEVEEKAEAEEEPKAEAQAEEIAETEEEPKAEAQVEEKAETEEEPKAEVEAKDVENKVDSKGTSTAGESQVLDLSTESFKAFCSDMSAMFSIGMKCDKQEAATVTIDALKERFKNLVAITSAKADGALEGTFQIIFSREGLFTLAGAISMPAQMTSILEKCVGPEKTMKNIKSGSLKEAKEVSDTVTEACNLLIGSWDRIFREGLEGHKHLLQTDTFIGDPWDNPKEKIGMSNEEEYLFAPCKITISSFPAFDCGAIFPKTIFAKVNAEAEAEEKAKADAEEKAKAETEEKPKTETEDKPEAEVKTEATADKDKPEAEAKQETEEKAETKDETTEKPEAVEEKTEAKPETTEEPKAESETEAKAEAEADKDKPEVEAKQETEEKAETKDETTEKPEAVEEKTEAKPETTEEPKAESETEAKAEAEADKDKPKAEAKQESEEKAETKDEVKAEGEIETKSESEEKTPVPDHSQESAKDKISESIQKMAQSPAILPGESGKATIGHINVSAEICATDIMQKEVVWATSEESVQQAMTKMQQQDSGYIMIGKDGVLEGIVSKSDITGATSIYLRPIFAKWYGPLDDATLQIKLKWIMSRPVRTVRPETPLVTIIENICRFGGRGLPVVDEQSQVQGLVTVFDIFRTLLNTSENVSTVGKTAEAPAVT